MLSEIPMGQGLASKCGPVDALVDIVTTPSDLYIVFFHFIATSISQIIHNRSSAEKQSLR